MYQSLKKIIKGFIPSRFLNKNETLLRSSIAFFYKGNTYQCNLCGFKLSKFVVTENFGSICPKCGSISRNRRLWTLIKDTLENKKVLHFSPSHSLKEQIQKANTKEYITTDYLGEFQAMKKLNIEAIDEPDNYYDVIICYHVLEHVVQDRKAMQELYRILKPNGICYVQTPFKEGENYEDATIVTEADRLKYFGQEDHLRIYSVSGLSNRLQEAGFKIDVFDYEEDAKNVLGFLKKESVIIASKN
ncbi:class I SAM-dependent methyltransferase [Lacinutrix himadriensis]|uniref:class I SAM-dependent methyltransferase n=1 Tax=Lacinutrix himadriensis TaxID=641549 RepID=UPI0006E1A1BA|nr:class I SAM-dependent methyltransferase [Lacinutrix himadriensis]